MKADKPIQISGTGVQCSFNHLVVVFINLCFLEFGTQYFQRKGKVRCNTKSFWQEKCHVRWLHHCWMKCGERHSKRLINLLEHTRNQSLNWSVPVRKLIKVSHSSGYFKVGLKWDVKSISFFFSLAFSSVPILSWFPAACSHFPFPLLKISASSLLLNQLFLWLWGEGLGKMIDFFFHNGFIQISYWLCL